MRKTLTLITMLVALAIPASASAASPVVLPAGVVQTGPMAFQETAHPCSCVTTIAGNLFAGMPYVAYGAPDANGDGLADDSSVGLWFLLGEPVGVPITSISTTTTVSGTVPGGPGDSTDSYGTG